MNRAIAYFITPHGFGHASRASAVMSALLRKDPDLQFEIYTSVPKWVFQDSVGSNFTYHLLQTDVGLVQENPFQADLDATIDKLSDLLPFRAGLVDDLARQLKDQGCRMVLCDTAALGIAAARAAQLPSALIENFTWDWIYESYLPAEPRFAPFIQIIRDTVSTVDYLIQTEPLCERKNTAALTAPPISRRPRNDRAVMRARLGIPLEAQAVLITTGGIQGEFPFLDHLREQKEIFFIVPGAGERFELDGNLVLMPHHSEFFHPDLTFASDAVVGKAGYSTIAEVYHAGIPFGYVVRAGFRESEKLAEFIRSQMQGFEIPEAQYPTGAWASFIPDLLNLPQLRRPEPNGADLVADFVLSRI